MQLPKLLKSSALYSAGNILTKAVGFLLLPFYTRYLSTSEYGVIELIELVISLTSIVFGLGILGGAMARIFHEVTESADKRAAITSTLCVAFLVSACAALVGSALSPALSRLIFQTGAYASLMSTALSLLVLTNVAEVSMVYLRISDRPALFVAISCAQFVAMALLNIYFIGYLHLGVWGFVYSKMIVYGISALLLARMVFRDNGFQFKPAIAGKVLRFGTPLIGYAVAVFTIHFSDRFVLQYYRGLSEVGVYSIAYKLAFLITYVVGEPFARVWNVRLFAHTSEPGWKQSFADIFAYFALALILAWTVIGYFSSEITQLMVSAEFRGAAALVPLLALAYVFREFGEFARQLLYINKRSGLSSRIAMFCALTNVALNFLLIAPYGAAGAMWATLLTWMLYAGLMYHYSQKDVLLSYRPAIPVYLVVAVALYLPTCLITTGNLLHSFVFHLALLLVFLVTLLRGSYLTRGERLSVKSKCSALVSKYFAALTG